MSYFFKSQISVFCYLQNEKRWNKEMDALSDELLKKTYIKSKELSLDPEFIQLLELELKRRLVNIKNIEQKMKGS